MKIDGMVRQQFGGTQITRHSVTAEVISLADDLKAATSDALKKCASAFGVGLYLYGGQHPDARYIDEGGQNGNGHNGHNDKISNEIVALIFANARSAGVPQSQVIRAATEKYGKPVSQLTRLQANEVLDLYRPVAKGA
jgi:hypothetical protein